MEIIRLCVWCVKCNIAPELAIIYLTYREATPILRPANATLSAKRPAIS